MVSYHIHALQFHLLPFHPVATIKEEEEEKERKRTRTTKYNNTIPTFHADDQKQLELFTFLTKK